MLTHLHIENLMLIELADVTFDENFVAITGESGSGKSSLMEALKLALGAKSSPDLIRRGQNEALVRATFDLSGLDPLSTRRLKPLFEHAGLQFDIQEPLIIQRRLYPHKPNKALIGLSPVTLQILASIGLELVEVVDAGSSYSLNNLETHLDCLDAFAGIEEMVLECESLWHQLQSIEPELTRLHQMKANSERQRELIHYQIEEIEQADLKDEEENLLYEEFKLLSNSEQTLELLSHIEADVNQPIFHKLGRHLTALKRLQTHWKNSTPLVDCLHACLVNIQEAQSLITTLSDEREHDPKRLETTQKRLDLIHLLKKKYGATLDQIKGFHQSCLDTLQELDQVEVKIQNLSNQQLHIKKNFELTCKQLSLKRHESCCELTQRVTAILHELNMPHAVFQVSINSKSASSRGCDYVEFFIQPNPGEPILSVRRSASGGEMARLFLALKTLRAHKRIPPTLIFDEIDASIGGQSAAKLALKFESLSHSRQVLCITHFPQVAERAKQHVVMEKAVEEGRTYAVARMINHKSERLNELQRMLGKKTH
jgi:DNA repair protein RecN (Recombination protein N)